MNEKVPLLEIIKIYFSTKIFRNRVNRAEIEKAFYSISCGNFDYF
jgi:hypothetical protein